MGNATTHQNLGYVPTVVIGGGQAGLTMGYHLRRSGETFVILDAMERTGDSWRQHWDSLRLFSQPRYASLPGWRNPARSFPTRDEMADYLEQYADKFSLPIRHSVQVRRLSRSESRFRVDTSAGCLTADRVVVATGAHQRPRLPRFAADLDSAVHSLHSSTYRGPDQLNGRVLVVGAGNSGADIALESAANGHETVIAGRHPGEIPFDIDGPGSDLFVPIVMFAFRHVLTLGTPAGRAMWKKRHGHGVNLVRHKRRDFDRAGIRQIGRVAGVRDGHPLIENGDVLTPDTVVWCTGYEQDFGWIDLPVLDEAGEVVHRRGVVENEAGLFFLGLDFQYAAASATIQGLDRDARHVLRALSSVPTEADADDVATEEASLHGRASTPAR